MQTIGSIKRTTPTGYQQTSKRYQAQNCKGCPLRAAAVPDTSGATLKNHDYGLGIEYINNNKEKSRRNVEPIGLAMYKDNWHMIGWCHKRKDYRDFKVLRITRLQNTGKPFIHNGHPGLEQYLKRNSLPYTSREYRQTV